MKGGINRRDGPFTTLASSNPAMHSLRCRRYEGGGEKPVLVQGDVKGKSVHCTLGQLNDFVERRESKERVAMTITERGFAPIWECVMK